MYSEHGYHIPPPAGPEVPSPAASPERPASIAAAALRSIERLERALDAETAALRERKAVDLGEFNKRKSAALLELTRSMRGVEPAELGAAVLEKVRALRAKLEENRAVLALHLRAAREVADLVAEAMRSAESDGTYAGVAAAGPKAWRW
jgi:hypothetical protein